MSIKIHTFGDSHSKFGWEKIPGVKINHLGPMLCYTFGKYSLSKLDIKKYGVKENDYVVFCFGEIDCRCHVKKHITDSKNYKNIIDELVFSYFNAINDNIKQYKKINVIIYNVIPPLRDNHPIVIRDNISKNNPYPFVGNEDERRDFIKYFNYIVKKRCIEVGYVFLDTYDNYSDKDGFLIRELSDGNVHINDPEFIKKTLKF